MKCLRPLFVRRFPSLTYKDWLRKLQDYHLQPEDVPFKHYVPCGKCAVCRYKDGRKWAVRLLEKYNESANNYFCTLTYTDSDFLALFEPDQIPQLNKEHLRVFINKFKSVMRAQDEKQLRRKYGFTTQQAHKLSSYPQYYAIGDYGELTYRPHYHFLLFNSCVDSEQLSDIILKCWPFGVLQDVRTMIPQHCNYVVKYLTTSSPQYEYAKAHDLVLPFRLTSRGLMPSDKRLRQIGDEIDNGFYYLQHHRGKYGIPAYLKYKANKFRHVNFDDQDKKMRLEAFYNDVCESDNFVSFVDENNYLLDPTPPVQYSDSEIKYYTKILNDVIKKSKK